MNINEPTRGGMFSLPFIKDARAKRRERGASSLKSNRLPFLNALPDSARNHFVATSAEYAGTTLFLFFAFSGTQVALLATPTSSPNVVGAVSDPSQLMFIALSFGFSLAVNAWVFFRISGGLFNPAVTLGMCLVGALPYLRGLFLFIAQVLGGITAAAICSALFPGPLTVRTNLGGGTSVVQGLFIEMFLSAELVFTIFMLAAEKHKGTFIAPIGIGLSLFIAELTGVYFTGGSVNPARSFGPSVVSHQFHTYHWIYWVGPILGSLLASGFYKFIKMLEYETANPGQDAPKEEGEHFNPDLDTTHPRVSFAPGDYAASGPEGKIGDPREYGTERRPFSDSPAPPHVNDQFRGLESGILADADAEVRRGGPGSESDQATLAPTGSVGMSEAANPYNSIATTHASTGINANSITTSPTTATSAHTYSPTTSHTTRSAMKAGTTHNGPLPANGTERSARKNMYYNQNMHSAAPRDDEFYDKV